MKIKTIASESIDNQKKMDVFCEVVKENLKNQVKAEKKLSLEVIKHFSTSVDTKLLLKLLLPIQTCIANENSSIFGSIVEAFTEVVINFNTNAASLEDTKPFEYMQGFCVYNMTEKVHKANHIVGAMALNALIQNSELILSDQYLPYVFDKIVALLEKSSFSAKVELLSALLSLIFKAELLIRKYSSSAIFTVINFIKSNDIAEILVALRIVFALLVFSHEELAFVKEEIKSFADEYDGHPNDKLSEVAAEINGKLSTLYGIPIKKTRRPASPIEKLDNNKQLKDLSIDRNFRLLKKDFGNTSSIMTDELNISKMSRVKSKEKPKTVSNITKNKKDHNSIFKGPRNNNFFKHKEGEIVIKTIKEEMDKSSHDHYNASAEKQEETSQLEEVIEKKPVEEETVTLKKKDYEALLKLNEDLFEVEV